MESVKLAGLELDGCPACRGLWFDAEELDASLRKDGAALGGLGSYFVKVETARSLDIPPAFCPRCRAALEPHHYDIELPLIIDVCPAGCGIWLDAGELARIKEYWEHDSDPWGQPTDIDPVEMQKILEKDESSLRQADILGGVLGTVMDGIEGWVRWNYPGGRL
jgi:Zn-finger nucleic acid-binding protein